MVSIIYLVFDFGRFFVYNTEKRLFAPAWAGRFCRLPSGGNFFPCCARGRFRSLRERERYLRPLRGRIRLHPTFLFLSAKEKAFFLPCRQARFCAPHFFFLVRKKKRAAPGAKKKEHLAAFVA